MDFERTHRSGSGSSELFVCFTSRNSSSMKISSKSILSPGRTDKLREPTLSSSSSLSRRLKSSGSIKGAQLSPIFPTGSKKRGCGFENPEPSSPKVTCIGQVRVKTKKKQGKKIRTRSRRYGEVSFRKTEDTQEGIQQNQSLSHRNQKWVHLPLAICEALRAFGAEFNCFLPCGGRSSCSSMNEREKAEKRRTAPTATTTSSCGAIFARWLMALQEGEDEKRREMEFVVGEEEKTLNGFGEIGIEIEEEKEMKELIQEAEEERLSICIPPRNALFLMRCRSEPLRMSALANRFWDSPNTKDEDYDEEDEEDSEDEANVEEESEEEEVEEMSDENREDPLKEEEDQEQVNPKKTEQQDQELKKLKEEEEEEIALNESSIEPLNQLKNPAIEEKGEQEHKSQERSVESEDSEERRASFSSSSSSSDLFVQLEEVANLEERVEKSIEEMETQERSATVENQVYEEDKEKSKERESQGQKVEEERERTRLPDCLLLMLYEPKLSMEVSKETWVRSTDFIRYRPNKQVVLLDGGDESKNRIRTDYDPVQQKQHQQQLHAMGPSMATMIEEKLVNAVAYEPLVLTRCKSEPFRSSAKLVPEACFWKNMKLESHRHDGVSEAGVGF